MPQEIGRFELFERIYAHRTNAANPFGVEVGALWRHESGLRLRVEGFCDGNDRFGFRFMPSIFGEWRFRVNVAGRLVDQGAITCVPSQIKGPLRQDPLHPYHLMHADGTLFYMMGNTAYNSISAYRHDRAAYIRFLDHYAARRFNWTRFFLLNTGWPTSGDVVWPWGGTPCEPDFCSFSLRTFAEAEEIIREMADRDMIASVILLRACDAPLAAAGEARMAAAKGLIRYAVARLGSYWNVVWNLANEWQRDWVFGRDDMDELGAYLSRADPYERLTACHHYGRFEFYDKEWAGLSSLQHRGLPHEINQWMLQNRHFQKPVINEEYGYEGDNHAPPNDADSVRHDHWAIAMAGGYGTYGDKTKGPKVGAYMSALLEDAVGTSAPDSLRHLQSFMERTGFRRMVPANAFLFDCDPRQAFCLAEPGQEYIVYLVRGQPFGLNLTHVHGALSATWYNPRTGERTPETDVIIYQSMDEASEDDQQWNSSRGLLAWHNKRFTPPDCEGDWVLRLTVR